VEFSNCVGIFQAKELYYLSHPKEELLLEFWWLKHEEIQGK
jgi:hypothetical protein